MANPAEISAASARINDLREQMTDDPAGREALAAALVALADLLQADDRFDEATQSVQEAIEILSPAFGAKPVMHEATMNVLVNRYLSLVRRTDARPDAALLQPIAEIQARLNNGDDDNGE